MLTREENERLTRVCGDAPMGALMRRYWVPVVCSDEVSEPDGTPVRVRVFGEDLVVFRDSNGQLGLIEAACPHRLASLALGRNEECGLRCIYHGWKFDVAGNCVEMPTEPEGFGYRERTRVRAYPVREYGSLVWAYMGPPEHEPAFPAYDWGALPADQRVVFRSGERTNWLQAAEGSIDSSHSWFLHRGVTDDWRKRIETSSDLSPRLEAEDTAYGFRYAAIRKPNHNADREKYVRVTLWLMPGTACIPRPLDPATPAHVQIFVPVDDTHTMFFGIFFSQDGAPRDTNATRTSMRVAPGIDLDAQYYRRADETTMWGQDRAAMKRNSYTGIDGFTNQDMAVQESMGPIVDRTREHLGTSDVAIIRLRRRLIENLDRFTRGEPPIGLDGAVPYERIRSEQLLIPIEQPWQTVGAYADEMVPR
jgi:phthalate 4,5-dioxygenase